MSGTQEPASDGKLSSTWSGMSRQNSLSSLPETECEWTPVAAQSSEVTALEDPALREHGFIEIQPTPELAAVAGVLPPHVPPPPPQPPALYAGTAGSSFPPAQIEQEAVSLFFQVAYLGGIEVRIGPDFNAPRTGLVLPQGEVFATSQQMPGMDGRIYLCLADGQGWVFDDSNLMPEDPSIVPLQYVGLPAPSPLTMPSAFESELVVHHGLDLPYPDVVLPPVLPVAPAPCGELLASTPVGMTDMSPMLSPACASSAPPAEVAMAAAPMAAASMATPVSPPVAIPVAPQEAPPMAAPVSWFRVAYLGGINLRCAPAYDAPLTGVTLPQNETFPVCEELPSADGRVYLCLCDGRGWAFDDSALLPHDPCVKRGQWTQPQIDSQNMVNPYPTRRNRAYPQPRGKRGGKRCAKRAPAPTAAAAPGPGAKA